MTEHTPAPWVSIHLGTKRDLASHQDFCYIRGAHQCGDDTAIARLYNGENGHDVMIANARIIAASPDLLTVAESVVAWANHQVLLFGTHEASLVVDAARAAIAKAKGVSL